MATATLESDDTAEHTEPECEDDRYTAYKKLIIRLAERLGSDDVRAINYLQDLPEECKSMSPLEVLQRLERHDMFNPTFVSDLLDMLKSIHRADLVNYVDEYRKKYSQPKRGKGSDPTPHGRWPQKLARVHRRNMSASSGLSLEFLRELMQEDRAAEGSQLSISSASSTASTSSIIKMADFAGLSLDGALQVQQTEREGSASSVYFRSSSAGTINSCQSRDVHRGQRSPHASTPTHLSVSPVRSCSPGPTSTLHSVISNLQEWKVDRDKLNRAIYSHKENSTRLPSPIDLDLASLGFKCRTKFHFILHPYGVDIDRGKNTTLEVKVHLPSHLVGHDLDNTRIVLHTSVHDQDAQETINDMTIDGVLNQHKMLIFGFLPHLALKESHSRQITMRGQITAMLTREAVRAPTNARCPV